MKKLLRPIKMMLGKLILHILETPDLAHRMFLVEKHIEKDQFSAEELLSQRISILADRIGILESSVNWRLYGMPARVVNIKMEQAGLLSASGDVEWALSQFQSQEPVPDFTPISSVLPQGLIQKVLVFPGIANQEFQFFKDKYHQANFFVVDDPFDLYNFDRKNTIEETDTIQVIKINSYHAASLLSNIHWDILWVSSLFERMTPIQILIFLKRAYHSFQEHPFVFTGYFTDYEETEKAKYFMDPRRLRPLTKDVITYYIRLVGFKDIQFYEENKPLGRYFFKIQ
jgi:hypothetical protein